MPKISPKNIADRLRSWLGMAQAQGRKFASNPRMGRLKTSLRTVGGRIKERLPRRLRTSKAFRNLDFDFRKIELKSVSEHSTLIRWVLLVLAIYLTSEIISKILGVIIRPVYTPLPKKVAPIARVSRPTEDYDSILRRNMFNVEGKIPEPFDQGQLDCLSQARPSTQRIQLLGTIVMNDEYHSVALVQEEGNPLKIAVKKDESFFDGKYMAMKVDRKKLCFQVRGTQEFEFVEIPEDNVALGFATPALTASTEGVTPVSETDFSVKRSFLDDKLGNLNEILQTAKAVPYIENGKFKGFLVQSIDAGSPFAQLGVRQGDILTAVNDIQLDNAGKGLEAFQRLRNSPRVAIEVSRGGQRVTLNYNVQ